MEKRNERKIKERARRTALEIITAMAAVLVYVSVGIIDTPVWTKEWIPVQICMFGVGAGWTWLFLKANGWFEDYDEYEDSEDEEEWDM